MDTVKYLVETGHADIDVRSIIYGTALELASRFGKHEVAEYLTTVQQKCCMRTFIMAAAHQPPSHTVTAANTNASTNSISTSSTNNNISACAAHNHFFHHPSLFERECVGLIADCLYVRTL